MSYRKSGKRTLAEISDEIAAHNKRSIEASSKMKEVKARLRRYSGDEKQIRMRTTTLFVLSSAVWVVIVLLWPPIALLAIGATAALWAECAKVRRVARERVEELEDRLDRLDKVDEVACFARLSAITEFRLATLHDVSVEAGKKEGEKA